MAPISVQSQFAGEAFGTDNVRTVFAAAEEDDRVRPTRTIVLVGPIGAGKSAFIDFLCNYFYGVRFDTPHRYRIADECFDNTTPEKAVTKYVFNKTQMPYRPIVIDTPGVGDPTGLKANRELAPLVTDYFNKTSGEQIHALCLVVPNFMHSVNDQIDSDIKLTLSLFPEWMKGNVVPIVTFSEDGRAKNEDLLRHFGLEKNARFCVNTGVVFQNPDGEPLIRRQQRQQWDLSWNGVGDFVRFVNRLQPQTISRPLSPESVATEDTVVRRRDDRPVASSSPSASPLPNRSPSRQRQYAETDEYREIREERTIVEGLGERKSAYSILDSSGIPLSADRSRSAEYRTAERQPKEPPRERRPTRQSETKMRTTTGRTGETTTDEIKETEELELLRRYVYDPITRTYKIHYIHEVSTRESRRSSGRQSLRASESDLRRFGDSELRGDFGGSRRVDDSVLGNLAEELRRKAANIRRTPSAPHLATEYDKENARRGGFDYSPETLKRLLTGVPSAPSSPKNTLDRPTVLRQPYETPRQSPLRPLQPTADYSTYPGGYANGYQRPQEIPTEIYNEAAIRAAREQRSASRGFNGSPQQDFRTPERSFDDKERLFERNSSARQSPARRGGVRHAIAQKPADGESPNDWSSSDTERAATLGRSGVRTVPIAQPRTVGPTEAAGRGTFVPRSPYSQPFSPQPATYGQPGGPAPVYGQPVGQGQPYGPPGPQYVQSAPNYVQPGAPGPQYSQPGAPGPQYGQPQTLRAQYSPTRQQPLSQTPQLPNGYLQTSPPTRPQHFQPHQDRQPLQADTLKGGGPFDRTVPPPRLQKNRKNPSFARCCLYVIVPVLIVLITTALIITLVMIA